MDTVTEIVIWAFGIVNAVEILSHLPQIFVALGCRDGARSISLATWSYFAFAYFTGALYFVCAARDNALATLFFGNFLACVTLVCIVTAKRRRLAQTATPRPAESTRQTASLRIPRRLMPGVSTTKQAGFGRCSGGIQGSRSSRHRRGELTWTAVALR
jgi:hypothetical protein